MLVLTVSLVIYYNYNYNIDCEWPPHVSGGRNFTVTQRMRRISISTRFRDYFVIVATPIEIFPTEISTVRCAQFCEVMEEYYFRVTNWLSGEFGEEIILVRSRSDNVFEIGREYTFTVRHVSSTLNDHDFYYVTNLYCVLDNEDLATEELQIFHERINQLPSRNNTRRKVIEEAVPTLEIIENIDVAVIVTINEAWDSGHRLNASVELRDVVYGELSDDAFNRTVILRGEVILT